MLTESKTGCLLFSCVLGCGALYLIKISGDLLIERSFEASFRKLDDKDLAELHCVADPMMTQTPSAIEAKVQSASPEDSCAVQGKAMPVRTLIFSTSTEQKRESTATMSLCVMLRGGGTAVINRAMKARAAPINAQELKLHQTGSLGVHAHALRAVTLLPRKQPNTIRSGRGTVHWVLQDTIEGKMVQVDHGSGSGVIMGIEQHRGGCGSVAPATLATAIAEKHQAAVAAHEDELAAQREWHRQELERLHAVHDEARAVACNVAVAKARKAMELAQHEHVSTMLAESGKEAEEAMEAALVEHERKAEESLEAILVDRERKAEENAEAVLAAHEEKAAEAMQVALSEQEQKHMQIMELAVEGARAVAVAAAVREKEAEHKKAMQQAVAAALAEVPALGLKLAQAHADAKAVRGSDLSNGTSSSSTNSGSNSSGSDGSNGGVGVGGTSSVNAEVDSALRALLDHRRAADLARADKEKAVGQLHGARDLAARLKEELERKDLALEQMKQQMQQEVHQVVETQRVKVAEAKAAAQEARVATQDAKAKAAMEVIEMAKEVQQAEKQRMFAEEQANEAKREVQKLATLQKEVEEAAGEGHSVASRRKGMAAEEGAGGAVAKEIAEEAAKTADAARAVRARLREEGAAVLAAKEAEHALAIEAMAQQLQMQQAVLHTAMAMSRKEMEDAVSSHSTAMQHVRLERERAIGQALELKEAFHMTAVERLEEEHQQAIATARGAAARERAEKERVLTEARLLRFEHMQEEQGGEGDAEDHGEISIQIDSEGLI
jgi:hypothetical protein